MNKVNKRGYLKAVLLECSAISDLDGKECLNVLCIDWLVALFSSWTARHRRIERHFEKKEYSPVVRSFVWSCKKSDQKRHDTTNNNRLNDKSNFRRRARC